MKNIVLRLCALLAALGLYACDSATLEQLKPGLSTENEVRALMGTPSGEWPNADGSLTLEYTRQPEGMVCYMLTLGPDGILRAIDQAITPENMARIRPGMQKEDVRRLLGKPRSTQVFSLKQEEVWDWKVGRELQRDQYFNVHFDTSGQVTGTSRSEDMRG